MQNSLGLPSRHDPSKIASGIPGALQKVLEPQHGTGSTFDGAMVLLHDVIQVLDLANLDWRLPLGIHRLQRGQIGATFVDGYRLRCTIAGHGLFEEATGRDLVPSGPEQKIDGVARLIDCAIQVLPLAFDLDIALVHPPAFANRTLMLAERLSNSGSTLITQRHTVE
jgi:hypothetical protein